MNTDNPSGFVTGVSIGYTLPLYQPGAVHPSSAEIAAFAAAMPPHLAPYVSIHQARRLAAEAPAAESGNDDVDIRRALGIDEATWRRYNPPIVAPGLRTFSATPSVDDLKEWGEFAKRLMQLGMSTETAMRTEDLFFEVVRARRTSAYENEQPGRHGPGAVDIEKAQAAMKDVLKLNDDSEDPIDRSTAAGVWEALWILERLLFQMEQGSKGDFGHIPFRPSLAEMLRASLFVHLTHQGGVYDGRERQLFDLFWEFRDPRRTAKG